MTVANGYYLSYLNSLWGTPPNLVTGSALKAALVKITSGSGGNNYTPNLATDQFFSILPAGSIVAVGVALTEKSNNGGILSATSATFSAVAAPSDGGLADALVYFYDTGTPATSPLIGIVVSAGGTLPVTPDGSDITLAFASGVFAAATAPAS